MYAWPIALARERGRRIDARLNDSPPPFSRYNAVSFGAIMRCTSDCCSRRGGERERERERERVLIWRLTDSGMEGEGSAFQPLDADAPPLAIAASLSVAAATIIHDNRTMSINVWIAAAR